MFSDYPVTEFVLLTQNNDRAGYNVGSKLNQKENPTEVKQLPQVHNQKLKHISIVCCLHLTHVDKKTYEHFRCFEQAIRVKHRVYRKRQT